MNSTQSTDPYDLVPYPSNSYPQSHPDRLATLATLFGMKPAEVSRCRVLELGSSDGSNLIPMAFYNPRSDFVGVDLSEHASTIANQRKNTLKLKNLHFHNINIQEVDHTLGKFDYIIVHGIYSWVPASVQDAIMKICRDSLTQNGIAYVSYNTYPGWHMRGMLRDMMRYHTRKFTEPKQKIAQAKALVKFLSESIPIENNAYGMLLKSELEQMARWQDNYFYHDSLEEVNTPIYFHQFMEKANGYDLQYLSEAVFCTMLSSNFQQSIDKTLRSVAKNIIEMEQYMDFLRNRMFRQTLLCHKSVKLNRTINLELMKLFYISAPLKTENESTFKTATGAVIKTTNQLTQKMVSHLSHIWPQNISFNELAQYLGADEKEEVISKTLFDLYTKNLVHLHLSVLPVTHRLSERPKAGKLAQLEAKSTSKVTNLRHEPVFLDDINRVLLELLNGKNTHDDIVDQLASMIKSKKLMLKKDDEDITDHDMIHSILSEQLSKRLLFLSQTALLIN